MSDSIVACNSSYWSLLIAPQSSKACHFWSWSIHSDLMLTLRPGDVTKVVGAVHVLDVVAEDLPLEEDDANADVSDDFSED